ncbi:MAG: AMP-binding protein, partial [Verrucomicrobiales bacterium]|nr:AMP-binding protein [Verrucomicrobiales bacterium]
MNYPTDTLPQMLERTARRTPDATALIYFGARLSYAQLQEHVERLAAGLQALGLQKGDRVALLLPNCPQFVVGFFGALRAGGIVTPTSVMYTPRELAHQWHDAGARFAIVDRRFLRNVRAALPQAPELQHLILTGPHQYYPAA